MRQLSITTLGYVTLNIGLAASAGWLWVHGESLVREPSTVRAVRLWIPSASPINSSSSRIFDASAVRNQAVFYASRAFYQPPPPPTTISPPDYLLSGVLVLPDGKSTAFLTRTSDRLNRKVRIGDDLDSWRVEAIDSNRISLAHEEQRSELVARSVPTAQGLIRTNMRNRPITGGIRVLGNLGSTPSTAAVAVAGEPPHTFRLPPQ